VGKHPAADHDPAVGAGGRADDDQGAPRRPTVRATGIRRELSERGVLYAGRNAWDDVRLGAFSQPELLRWEGRTLGELVRDRNGDSVDVLCDLLLEEDLRVNQVTPGPWTETLRDFIRHPVGMIGTDSTFVGEKPSPRSYGSFPGCSVNSSARRHS
jgi:N-acyl-D-aspartate/D-glutamate deacylase